MLCESSVNVELVMPWAKVHTLKSFSFWEIGLFVFFTEELEVINICLFNMRLEPGEG